MDHNTATVKKIITTQQVTAIIEGAIVFMDNAHYSKIYKISGWLLNAESCWFLSITSTESDFPQQQFFVTV